MNLKPFLFLIFYGWREVHGQQKQDKKYYNA